MFMAALGIMVLIITVVRFIYMVSWLVKNKDNNDKLLLFMKAKDYESKHRITNIKRFNGIELFYNSVLVIVGIAIGTLFIATKNTAICFPVCLVICCINLMFDYKRNKCAKRIV